MAGIVLALVMMTAGAACRKPAPPAPRPAFKAALILDQGALQHPLRRAAVTGMEVIRRDLNAAITVQVAVGQREQRRRLRELGGRAQDLVFCLCPEFGPIASEEAPAFPETWLILIGGTAPGGNVATMDFRMAEAGYLAGVAAAAAGDGAPVGIIRGAAAPGFLLRAEDGFRRGFHSVRENGEVLAVDGMTGVDLLRERGVRVALSASESVEPELLASCRSAGVRLIAADPRAAESAPDVVLATLVLNLAEAMHRIAQEEWAGTLEAKVYSFDLGSGVIDQRLESGSGEPAQTVVEAVANARADVTAGIAEIEDLGM